MPNEMKTARIEARVAPDVRDMIVAAAKMEGRSVSDFLVMSATTRAKETLRNQEIIQLSAESQKRFVEALLNPPPLNDAMQRALAERDQMFGLS